MKTKKLKIQIQFNRSLRKLLFPFARNDVNWRSMRTNTFIAVSERLYYITLGFLKSAIQKISKTNPL